MVLFLFLLLTFSSGKLKNLVWDYSVLLKNWCLDTLLFQIDPWYFFLDNFFCNGPILSSIRWITEYDVLAQISRFTLWYNPWQFVFLANFFSSYIFKSLVSNYTVLWCQDRLHFWTSFFWYNPIGFLVFYKLFFPPSIYNPCSGLYSGILPL